MAIVERQTARDLADQMLADACNTSLHRLLEQLHALHGDDLETRPLDHASRRRIRLQSHAGLGFPASDVVLAERLVDSDDHDDVRYRVQTSFFGMHGPDSPLPTYYLDRLAHEHAQGQGIRPAFLDFFNHRLLTLLHYSWRRYRYYIRFQVQASDHFSRYVFSLIGLNDNDLRGATPLPWGRLLSFAGLIAGRSRSPSAVAGIVEHCFDLRGVYIREFEARCVRLPHAQRLSLGRANGTLGSDCVLGERTWTRASLFTLVIPQLSQARFREFLPSGVQFGRLRQLMNFLLRDANAYNLELGLREEDVPPFNLQRQGGTHLGWTSFIERQGQRHPAVVRIRGRA
ncbi:type VI secretion system baseplate subunit TssG [Pseudomonas gingeri NCPPB 3146 = LMG 5327]|uniref:Type VI secretion system baseplate subunit TssG n=2 Tax=Pseudomonas gingeri TaxID=117681 RepID=A0A7Y7Y4V6_9PSED|nr:type VI secretion system baseplate subunit TssG [Pseudomonas gingeri]NWC17840.1 type VI secretion system baseplate subunit TssG [Pseudomonas gingeri]PNQ94117.1 type VI secretion system baseplate subunit TssG [Pseudomonas gingeri NCPPB 3146 = LMG 5327]